MFPNIAIIQCIANENVIKDCEREENFLMGTRCERKMFSHLNVYRRFTVVGDAIT
jgi:hypothetical protein